MMKRKNEITVLGIMMAMLLFMTSCGDDADVLPEGTNDEKEEAVVSASTKSIAEFITLKSDLSKLQSFDGASFGSQMAGGRASARMKAARQDSSEYDGDYWESCAEITESEDNGIYTVVYDYGDGCEEGDEYYSVFNYGKFTTTFKYDFSFDTANWMSGFKGSYEGSMAYEDFGTRYEFEDYKNEFVINGTSNYSSSFEEDFNDEDGLFGSTFESAYSDNLSMTEITDSSSVSSTIKSDVEEVYEYTYNESEDSYEDILTINKADYIYTVGDEIYTSKVIVPLVLKWNCDSGEEDSYMFTYVSGVEEVTWEGATYTIDYGDGTCDNIITVTDENGNVEVIDLSTGDLVG